MRTFLVLRRIQRSQLCQFAISPSHSSPTDSAHHNNVTSKPARKRSKEKAPVDKPSRKRTEKAKDKPIDAHEEVPLSKVPFKEVFKKRFVYECMLCESKPWFGPISDALSHLREVHNCEREPDSKRKCYMCGVEKQIKDLQAHFRKCPERLDVYVNGGMTAEVWHYMTQYANKPDLAPPCESLESGDNCVYAILHPDKAQKEMPPEKRIVYYGITDRIRARMSLHCNKEDPDLIRFDGPSKTVRYVVLAENLSLCEAEELERILVYSHKPGLLMNTDFPKVEVPFTAKDRIRAAAYIAATLYDRIPINKRSTRETKIDLNNLPPPEPPSYGITDARAYSLGFPFDVVLLSSRKLNAESQLWRNQLEAARRRDLLSEDVLLSALSVNAPSLRPRSIVLRPESVHPLIALTACPRSLITSNPMVDNALVPVLPSGAEKEYYRWRRFTPRQWALVAALAVTLTLVLAVAIILLF